MILLALTTSGTRAQVGLFASDRSQILENPNPRQHSEWLHSAIAELLANFNIKSAGLGGVAVDLGPGSFTGLRVGFQLAQTLTYANQTPLFTATSPELLAAGVSGRVLCASNAFRNLVYCAEFQDGKMLKAVEVQSVAEYRKDIETRLALKETFTAVGDAFTKLPELQDLEIRPERELPDAESLAQLALQASPELWTKDWKSRSPLYLRGSEAEERAKIK